VTTKKVRARGRPRQFDPEEAIATAQQLFHARGYDAVSVADVAEALGINPPSFYSAFGNKAGLYTRVLDRYAATGAIPLGDLLRPERPVAECLANVLEEAARLYAADPANTGCLVLEGTRCNDLEARHAAYALNLAGESVIRDYIAARYPNEANAVTDFISTLLSGLSAKARNGHTLDQLLSTARLAALSLTKVFRADT
jgi:TetR/AcrR family transcriptional regulator, repressor for divergent bdcA